jgi:hypothetical protein
MAALLGGLFLAMLGREIQTPEGIEQAALTIAASSIAIVIGTIAVVTLLSRGRRLERLILHSTVGDASSATRQDSSRWLGWFGASAHLPRGVSPQRPIVEPTQSIDNIRGEEQIRK